MYVTKTWSVVLLNKKIHILLSEVYCVWQVVKTSTITSNNPVYSLLLLLLSSSSSSDHNWPRAIKQAC